MIDRIIQSVRKLLRRDVKKANVKASSNPQPLETKKHSGHMPGIHKKKALPQDLVESLPADLAKILSGAKFTPLQVSVITTMLENTEGASEQTRLYLLLDIIEREKENRKSCASSPIGGR